MSLRTERPADVERFLAAVDALCLLHGMVIEHEDRHGGFVIERRDADHDGTWLQDAAWGGAS